jgi:hypothetical protein
MSKGVLYMLAPNRTDEGSLLAAWRAQLEQAQANPFLFQLLLKQYQRILKRLAYFYAQLASLPRRNRRALQRALATSLIGAAMLLALSSAPIVHAASITVSGACTLDEAITNANNDDQSGSTDCAAGSGADTIYLTADVILGTNTPGALPTITSEITLEGNNYYVSGANTYRVFYVESTGNFTINDTTVQDGYTLSSGGGIFNAEGVVNVNNSIITGNSAGDGGGIYTYRGNVTLTNSSIDENIAGEEDGGGILNNQGYVRLFGCTVSGNTAEDDGGGLQNSSNGEMLIVNSTLSGNSADDQGGGFRNSGSATTNFFNVTIVNNSSNFGGGIAVNSGEIWLERTIVSGNSSPTESNEIYNDDTIYANNYNLFGHSGEDTADAFEGFAPGSSDINATSDGLNVALASILDTTLALNSNPNGTLTHALVSGSPALDKAPNVDCSASPIDGIDQRGFPRNVNINGGNPSYLCDIGAFELQLTTAVNVTNVRGVARADKNVLKWQTTTEAQIAGFNVYRKNGKGDFKQINAALKQAKHAGSIEGARYSFRDKKVNAGNTYRYKIQVIYLDGHTEWTEVVRVKAPQR